MPTRAPAAQAAPAGFETSRKAAAIPVVAGAVGEGSAGTLAAMLPVTTSLKLIRTAHLTVEVARYEQAASEVARVAEMNGGYLADAQAARGREDRPAGTLTIRVPSERFAAALSALKGLGKVRTETVASQDVTKAYADLETRLRVKRETAERLRDLLRTRTARLADVLEAERELARVTEEIERMEGERRFYDHQVALSTITVALHEPQAIVEPGVFSPVTDAVKASLGLLSQSVAAMVYVVAFAAPWLVVALLGWRVAGLLRSRRKAMQP
jgi:hypothetical protein